MQPLEKETLKIIRQEQLTRTGDRIIIGVSGGPDSLALLHVMARLAPDLNITQAAVYVNHGLRPVEALEELRRVKEAANSLGVDFFTGNVDVKGLAAKQKISIEHAARLLRYDFFENTAEAWGATKIAVAHTADDQAEEVLLRLIRGTARKGLSGMKTIRDGCIIRPFLCFPKFRLLEYLEKNSISFLLDSSNTENIYLRNRIRNDLLPYLAEEYNPDIRQTLLRTTKILQDEEGFLENITESVFKKIVSTKLAPPGESNASSRLRDETGTRELSLNLEHFNREPRAVQRRLLEKSCWEMGCAAQSRQIENLLELAIKNEPDGSLHLSDGLRVTKNSDMLYFNHPLGRGPFRGDISPVATTALPETTIPKPGIFEFPKLGKKLLVEHVHRSEADFKKSSPPGEYLDASLFSFPLTLRGPMPGDRFHPLGAPGSKKVGDFLSDLKVARNTRSHVPVLCTSETIIALPGLRIDHRYRVTDKTSQFIRVCWEEMK